MCFRQLKPQQCLNVKAGRLLETAEEKRTINSYVPLSEVLIHLQVEHVFIAVVAGSIKETNLLTECK